MGFGKTGTKKKKVLFCATVDGHIAAFHLPFLRWFSLRGYEVHVAAAGQHTLPYCDVRHEIRFTRSPLHPRNIKAYFQLKKLIGGNNYTLIHFHTPIAGLIGRMAAKKARKRGTKVLYTAHGFHFYRGAPAINWLVYYTLEKAAARHTDALLLVNEEDYALAASRRFGAGTIEKLDGMGVDPEKFKPMAPQQRQTARREMGFSDDNFLLIYAGEFNQNKNQAFLIEAVRELRDSIPGIRLLLAGRGQMEHELKRMANRLGVQDNVVFLGFRDDLEQIIPLCDVGVSSSRREGLPLNVVEYIACGLPVVVSDIRGHRDIVDGCGGYLYPPGARTAFCGYITGLYRGSPAPEDRDDRWQERFGSSHAFERITQIYRQYLGEKE